MLTPSETLPLQGPFKGEGLKAHSRPLKGAGRGGGDARQTDEQLRWGAATRSKTALVPSKQHRHKPAFSRAHSALDKLSHGVCRRTFWIRRRGAGVSRVHTSFRAVTRASAVPVPLRKIEPPYRDAFNPERLVRLRSRAAGSRPQLDR